MKRIRTSLTGIDGAPWLSTMFFGDTPTAQECVDHVADFWGIVEDLMVTAVAWSVDPFVATVDPVSGEITGATTVDGANGQGSAGGEVLPPATQMLVRWGTGIYTSGRELRGRTFVPGLTSSANDNGFVEPTTLPGHITDLETWLSTGPPLLIWSRAHGVTAPVAGVDIWNRFAILRSRRD